ncbi:hypothetical protein ACKI14_49385, partial [Streptomyces turgidiscabies]|uniref:hypothetical protein n=1 Tax=Streptomyces turgidiscabies TaxID=85558 RepID=UPI0038F73B07
MSCPHSPPRGTQVGKRKRSRGRRRQEAIMGMEGIGQSVVRKEDKRFITGKGKYTDDIRLHGMTHAHFVRSPHAHARVKSVDT